MNHTYHIANAKHLSKVTGKHEVTMRRRLEKFVNGKISFTELMTSSDLPKPKMKARKRKTTFKHETNHSFKNGWQVN